MRTIEVCLYKFDELSEEAKENALRNITIDNSFWYQEAHETVKKFHNVFGTREGDRSWLDIRTGHIDSDILELSGFRLQKYIWNNFGDELFIRKYLKHGELVDKVKPYHRMMKQRQITSKCPNQGKWSISYYSNIQRDNSCVLTGVCYDDCILDPIYKFLELRNFDHAPCFEGLLEDCVHSLRKSLESEDEYNETDAAKIDHIEANDYEFDEDGNRA
jgi:hypothetical protein